MFRVAVSDRREQEASFITVVCVVYWRCGCGDVEPEVGFEPTTSITSRRAFVQQVLPRPVLAAHVSGVVG